MAFRLNESVIHGDIDNRIKGVVRGRVWLAGKSDPLILNLKGNAWPDLAGCFVTFKNRLPPQINRDPEVIAVDQSGTIGDITASRKVRVFDVPIAEAHEMIQQGKKPPEQMANSLYLEWFSNANGRIVIESVDYDLKISDPEWRMTADENRERAALAGAGLASFMSRLNFAIEKHRERQKSHEEEWNEHDYEKFLKECDARTDKLMELQELYGHGEEAQEKIAEAMGWTEREEAEEDEYGDSSEHDDKIAFDDLAEPPQPDPAREGIDWIRDEDGDICHPLQDRCRTYSGKYLAFLRDDASTAKDRAIQDFVFEFQMTSAKLAGALESIADGLDPEPAFTIALLKRALNHLHAAQRGLETAGSQKSLPEADVSQARVELFEIRQGIVDLMSRLRA
jgi:hypothetical protein